MSLHNAIRSLTILLIFELAAVGPQAIAFTFGRTQEPSELTTDLAPAESSHLEVKNYLRGNDVTVINIKNVEMSQKIVPIETTAKTEDIQKNNTTTKNVEIEIASSTQTEIKETTITSSTVTSVISSSSVKETSETINSDPTEIYLTDSPVSEVSQRTTGEVSTVVTQDTSTATDVTSKQTVINISDTTTNENQLDTKTEENNSTSYSTEPVETDETTHIDTSSNKNIDDNSQTERTLSTSETDVTDTSSLVSDSTDTTTDLVSQDTTLAEILAGDYSAGTGTPFWKIYTTIDRKRPTPFTSREDISITTEKDEEMVRANTAQSSISLEKAFSITSDIPSLERLKNELLSLTSKLPTTHDPNTSDIPDEYLSTMDTSKVVRVFGTPTIPSELTSEDIEPTRLGILTSQRAGFLDYSSKATETTKSDGEMISTKQNDEDKTTLFDVQDGLRFNKKSSMASQSQLAEDAINEELMKEEMLNDNLEYTKPYRGERFDVKNIQNTDAVNTVSTVTTPFTMENNPDTTTDDKLSVKPINADKQKNSGLYTVSPNYKPLKKIEVQQPKSFVRNPDDNSWRNESLSSLGIVFNAKNSTKSFTQVLKNKTETEWNALLDKYNKDEGPELRERLEKIAEIRKTKKKNKFGEIVYGDYEEVNVAADVVPTMKTNINEPAVAVEDLVTKVSPFIPSSAKPEHVTEATTATDLDIQKEEQLNIITTQIPKKQIVESYEGSDDDDVDYISLPNIDLKKFITPATTTRIPITTATPPMRQFLPDRKPTVQYFPPRVGQKVNVNDYDDDFQRKVNAFTIKEPKRDQPTTYPTVLPPYAAERDRYNYNPITTGKNTRPTTHFTRGHRPLNLNQNYNVPPVDQPNIGYAVVNPDGSYDRPSYVIKHLKDFINEAAKDSDEDRNTGYIITEVPARVVSTNEFLKDNKVKDYYDYESQFRKEVLDRFVENFNQNSERFKVDFPILYNTSVVHSKVPDNGKVQASSSAFIKRLYGEAKAVKPDGFLQGSYDPNCDRTVELSPEYELHYYVPEQEEREEVEPKIAPIPYRYRVRV